MTLVNLQSITHRYGTVLALSDVSLNLPPGPIGLIGQNGAGKSTLLKILLGLVVPTSGEGMVLGCDIRRHADRLRVQVGFMPEADALLPGMPGIDLVTLAGELSGMSRRQSRRRAHEVLSYLELEEARYRKCEEYSIGMKQRLKLACALVHDPQLLLLDEPTAGLDPSGRDAMLRLLEAVAQRHGKSLILSTHLLGDIERVCKQVVMIDRGKILGVGPIQDLCRSRQGRYRLRWSGDATRFLEHLQSAGAVLHAEGRADQAVVDVPENWPFPRFFECSQAGGVVLRAVVPEQEDLQQVYHRLMAPAAR